MLSRYKMYRGSRPADDPLPDGIRQDTRKHTRHCLRPTAEIVSAYLAAPSAAEWKQLECDYLAMLHDRFADDRSPFDDLAELARAGDVYLGCSCPTKTNPDPNRCHTILAHDFMKTAYPDLKVERP